MNILCLLGFHKWVWIIRDSKEGDFESGWSPHFYYKKCKRCGKKKSYRYSGR